MLETQQFSVITVVHPKMSIYKILFWQVDSSLIALVKCLTNWKMNLRWKPSILVLITNTEHNLEYIRFYNFHICREPKENKPKAIKLYSAMQLSYFTSGNTRCYDKILYIYTSWHLGLTAAFSNKHTE